MPANLGTDRVTQGREVYLAEGCQYCHSQYVRRGTHDELWWGPVRALDRGERPPTPGNRRVGPDLSNVGLRRSATWNEIHLRDPRAVVPGSRMPSFAHLFGDERGAALVSYLASLGADSGRERNRFIATAAVSVAPGSPERGAALFHRHCAACHGEDGAGGGVAASRFARPTMDLRSGRLPLLAGADGGAAEDSALARAIRFGIPPFLMPGHEWLNDLEVADLAAFVRRLGASSGPPS